MTQQVEKVASSFAQQGLWYISHLEPNSPAYNVPMILELNGMLDEERFERALAEIVKRHEVLRTRFEMSGNQIVQVILKAAHIELERIDLAQLPVDEQEHECRRVLDERARRPFNLSAWPLIRPVLVKLDTEKHVFALTLHHIVCDARSIDILFEELRILYEDLTGCSLPQLTVQYADFALWQRERLDKGDWKEQLEYWRGQLAGAPGSPRVRPDNQTNRELSGNQVDIEQFVVPLPLADRLREVARRGDATLFMVLLTVFKILLARETGETDIVVGTPMTSRGRPELHNVVGMFLNTLVLRTDFSGRGVTFADALRRCREQCLVAFANQDLPFGLLVSELAPPRSGISHPLFQSMFVLRQPATTSFRMGEVSAVFRSFEAGAAKFDLVLHVIETGTSDPLAGRLSFRADLYSRRTASRLVEGYLSLLESVARGVDQPFSKMPLTKEQVSKEPGTGSECTSGTPPEEGVLVHELVAAQGKKRPDAVAVSFGETSLTYAELLERAGVLAKNLRNQGVKPDQPVGLFVDRGLPLAVAVLGVLRSGAGYLPLDPEWPEERLSLVCSQAGTQLVVVAPSSPVDRLPPGTATVQLDLDGRVDGTCQGTGEQVSVGPVQLAYLMYTSGSTGTPNGVAMPHGPLANLVRWQLTHSSAGPGTRTLQYASLGFDVSFQEMFCTWAAGGELVLVDAGTRREMTHLLELIGAKRIERLFLPFIALGQLAEAVRIGGRPPVSLNEVIVAGEQLVITDAVRDLFKAIAPCRLVNQYGPTETHVVTSHVLDGSPASWPDRPPIGKPIDHVCCQIMDKDGRPVGTGAVGELYLGGACLARGYHRQEDLTAERFLEVVPPGKDEGGAQRYYRTGDLCRLGADGDRDFIGRIDSQLKIRGHRVEPGEIEAALLGAPGVTDAAVAAHPAAAGHTILAGYVVPETGQEIDVAEVRSYLAGRLPAHLVPAAIVSCESFPLTPSGKLDRRQLPPPSFLQSRETRLSDEIVPPRDRDEWRLAKLWEEVLDVHPIGVTDSFFDLGGDSLQAAHLFAAIHDVFGVSLPLSVLFRAPTIAELSELMAADPTVAEEAWSTVVELQPHGEKPPFICVHGGGGETMELRKLALAMGRERPFYALRFNGWREDGELDGTVEAMADRYLAAIHERWPDGRFHLGGYCVGGVVAFEMAGRLAREKGRNTGLLVLLDAARPGRSVAGLVRRLRSEMMVMRGLSFVEKARYVAWCLKFKLQTLRQPLHQWTPPETPDHKSTFFELLAMHAGRAYKASPYAGPGLVIHTEESQAGAGHNWNHLFSGEVEFLMTGGMHLSMLESPHVELLARDLADRLDKRDDLWS